jgi:hypothetical protein
MSKKEHWETIYTTKTPQEVSWTQPYPTLSVDLIQQLKLPLSASIIDIGGGDSLLVDALLELGYSQITVLDIADSALIKAQKRLGDKAGKINWIVSDILDFVPNQTYDIWHDRAAFHFLTSPSEIDKYTRLLSQNSNHGIVGTFSSEGPLKCSGIEITQYDEAKIKNTWGKLMTIDQTLTHTHITPFDTQQHFIFACLSKMD